MFKDFFRYINISFNIWKFEPFIFGDEEQGTH